MDDRTALARLRDALTSLYTTEANIYRVLDDAGINKGRIKFDSSVNTWHKAIEEAKNTNKLNGLMAVVLSEYRENRELQQAWDDYQRSREHSESRSTPEQSQRLLRVFLCHASRDKEAVRDLYRQLRGDGVEPWFDEENLLPGQKWQEEIPSVIRNTDVVVICLSKQSVDKEGYVQEEIKFALDIAESQISRTISVIPIRLEDCNVSVRLGRYHWVNLFEDNGYGRLIHSLQVRANELGVQEPQKTLLSHPRVGRAKSVWGHLVSRRALTFIGTTIFLIAAVSIASYSLDIFSWISGREIPASEPSPQSVSIGPTTVVTPVPTQTPSVISTEALVPTPTPTVRTWMNPKDEAVYVYVPAGKFVMGTTSEQLAAILVICPDCHPDWFSNEQPPHTVYVDDFWIMQTEVTNAQYQTCVVAGLCMPPNNDRWNNTDYADQPVTDVDWNQAIRYVGWVDGRLPTEAEWEKACRGTDGRIYPWGNEKVSPKRLNYHDSGLAVATDVRSYPPGAYNLYDMSGNVYEWIADWFQSGYYAKSPEQNPRGPYSDLSRVLRGGSFNDNIGFVRCAARNGTDPLINGDAIGFRVVRQETAREN